MLSAGKIYWVPDELKIDFQPHGAVVGAEDVGIDRGGGDLFGDAVGHQEIVDAPAGIIGPGVEHVAPPAVGPGGVGIQVAEGIRKARLQQTAEALSLIHI